MSFISLKEVVDFAIELEEGAYQRYKRAAELTESPAARKMFEELAQEEATHKEVFSKVDPDKIEEVNICKIPEATIGKYLKDVPFRPEMGYQEILTFALKAEENAYQLYKAAAGMTEDPRLQKTLLTFAEVELGHRRKIEALYEEKVLTEG
ncbi:MAG: ferritin family protein [Trichlorobacter sp.]|uniref:ferritin-like domain-containing protein n=1 Tax=Trichlorobacter sp. TaxID=2911007 RepID=UPI00255F3B51|nr:ferritin family protein [Trichlorobacter sp.]MDK9717158.1 ferritin family protein [Trichlorobacter sp.]